MKANNINSNPKKELSEFDRILSGQSQLLIVVHNNPDPDAIASAAALGFIAEKRCNVKASIAYGGSIGRAENRVMLRKLKIHLKQINKVRFERYDRIASVDTQPGAGNNLIPKNRKCQIVIDHHPKRRDLKVDFAVIKPEIGVTATVLIEWLKESELTVPADLATALAYAIGSETQDLGREATTQDIQAYLYVYTRSSIRKLAQIIRPKLPRSYFYMLFQALKKARTFRNLICAHLGDVHSAEIVSEMADFLLRYERMSWALCTGRFKNNLYISVRSSNSKAKAGKLVKSLTSDPDKVGGHDMIAGGYIPLSSGKKDELQELENKLSKGFAGLVGNKEVEWKPLLDLSEIS